MKRDAKHAPLAYFPNLGSRSFAVRAHRAHGGVHIRRRAHTQAAQGHAALRQQRFQRIRRSRLERPAQLSMRLLGTFKA